MSTSVIERCDRPLSSVQFPRPECPECGFPGEIFGCTRRFERGAEGDRLIGATEELVCLSPVCDHRWINVWGTGGKGAF